MNGSNNMMQSQMMGMMNNDIKINFDSSNLIEFISLPIIIKNHHPHPVIYCYTLERKKFGTNWNCNNCCGKYTYDQPSFYCIFCDYDICGNCVENLKINSNSMIFVKIKQIFIYHQMIILLGQKNMQIMSTYLLILKEKMKILLGSVMYVIKII